MAGMVAEGKLWRRGGSDCPKSRCYCLAATVIHGMRDSISQPQQGEIAASLLKSKNQNLKKGRRVLLGPASFRARLFSSLPRAAHRACVVPSLKEKKEKERKTEKLKKLSPGDPVVPGVNPVSLGSQNPKQSLLGTRGIPREYPVSKGYLRDAAFENSW